MAPARATCRPATLWRDLRHRVASGQYDFVFAGAPFETFSRARAGRPGPRPLMDLDNTYGLPKDQLMPV
eukprot:3205156-Alexandrium_andersonii.AAC.1